MRHPTLLFISIRMPFFGGWSLAAPTDAAFAWTLRLDPRQRPPAWQVPNLSNEPVSNSYIYIYTYFEKVVLVVVHSCTSTMIWFNITHRFWSGRICLSCHLQTWAGVSRVRGYLPTSKRWWGSIANCFRYSMGMSALIEDPMQGPITQKYSTRYSSTGFLQSSWPSQRGCPENIHRRRDVHWHRTALQSEFNEDGCKNTKTKENEVT